MEELNRRIASDTSDVGRILRALFLPKMYGDNFRLASEGAGQKSAALNLSYMYDIGDDWSAASSNGMLAASDEMAFLFGNPLRSAIVYYHNQGNLFYSYDILNEDQTAGTQLPFGVTIELRPGIGVPTTLPVPTAWLPHGPLLFPGYDRYGHNYVWVDGSSKAGASNTLGVRLNAAPVLGACRITWWIWDGMKAVAWESQTANAVGGAYYACTPPLGGAYMYVTIYTQDVVVTSASLSVSGNRDTWGHKSLVISGIDNQGSPNTGLVQQTYGIRVNAAAIKAMNNSTEIEKNGNIISCTVARGIPWTAIATGGGVLSGLQNYRERAAENGYYGVLLPDSDDDISEFYDDITTDAIFNNGTPNEYALCSYPLTERRPYKAISLSVPISAGRYFAFDCTHCVEFLTNSDLASVDVSPFSEDSLIAAIVAASTMETDYENPLHWKKILGTIGRYGSRAIGALLDSGAIEALGSLHPALKGPAMIGARIGFPLQKAGLKKLEKWAGDSYRNKTLDRYTEEFA